MIVIGFDYETELFGPGNLAPSPVCLSSYINFSGETDAPASLEELDLDCTELATVADGDLATHIRELLESQEIKVGANVAFDLAVACNAHPDLFPLVYRGLSLGQIKDVQIREKLLNLAEHGSLDNMELPDGSNRRISYSLATLTKRYLGINVEGKSGDDVWRLNYKELIPFPVADWPEEAVSYALLDSVYPTMIYHMQEQRRERVKQAIGQDPLVVEDFRVLANFSLYLMSCWGVEVDPEEHAKVKEKLAKILTPENMTLLVETGILRPAVPPEPYKNGAKDADGNPKMKKGKKASIDKKKLVKHVEQMAKTLGEAVKLRHTDKGNLQVDKAFLDDHYHLDPTLAQYRLRQSVQKLVTTELPRMEWPKDSGKPSKIIHPSFDVLKETGRTSSYASKIYPSFNCQNVKAEIRPCIVSRDGFYIYSVDYSGMELGTLAQKCVSLFGHSVLADKLNAGFDAHAYLGSQLALHLDEDFAASCRESTIENHPDMVYHAFKKCAVVEDENLQKFYKHYRTFAKPTGLGYPGGLGPDTFCTFAHATYGVEVTPAEAKELREIWFQTYPEMRLYFNWINNSCKDPRHDGRYSYSTPFGMYRAGATYCAAANGAALQSPSAEGAITAVCSVVEATFNPGHKSFSVLGDDDKGIRHRASMFVHDELLGEVRADVAHECAHEVAKLMIEAMRKITPDVVVKAEPVLMTRWDKRADAVFVDGRLVPWEAK